MSESAIIELIKNNFDLSPGGIIKNYLYIIQFILKQHHMGILDGKIKIFLGKE